MTAREWILNFYRQMQEAYGWTPAQIDDMDMLFLLEQASIYARIENAPEIGYIEEVLPEV